MGTIGITLGDVTGVGPEVALKAVAKCLAQTETRDRAPAGAGAHSDDTRYLFLGDPGVIFRTLELLRLPLKIEPYGGTEQPGRLFWINPGEALPAGLEPGSPAAARAALACLEAGAKLCLRQELDALVTAPVNKESIIRLGKPFTGQTEFLSELAGTNRAVMMLLGPDDRGRWLRVALATTHLPLRLVADQLTREKVELAIELAAQACADLGLPRARVAVCGLNPHAGEGGEIGTEEITTIRPAVDACRARGLDVIGPISADTLFHYALKGEYDAVVAMYHDQGLCPLKMAAFENGVNWTLGLPFIRTSPDHGTAYDIAGKGIANAASMLAAIDLARQLASPRAADRP